MVLLPSVLEEDIKAVKNGIVQLGGCKNPWRVNTAKVPSLSVLKRKRGKFRDSRKSRDKIQVLLLREKDILKILF